MQKVFFQICATQSWKANLTCVGTNYGAKSILLFFFFLEHHLLNSPNNLSFKHIWHERVKWQKTSSNNLYQTWSFAHQALVNLFGSFSMWWLFTRSAVDITSFFDTGLFYTILSWSSKSSFQSYVCYILQDLAENSERNSPFQFYFLIFLCSCRSWSRLVFEDSKKKKQIPIMMQISAKTD